MEYAVSLVLMFFLYSFVGWCTEVTLKYIQYHRFINRGFFTGPICPIYGSGALLITLAANGLAPLESGWITTFAVSLVLCGAVEYGTSWVMEKRFHARWWDYSGKPMNLHGRVWIGNLILFGLAGVLIVHGVNPLLFRLLGSISLSLREAAAGCMTTVFAADWVMTHFVLKLVRTGVESSEADSTEAIGREIRLLLSDRNIFYRRFADAYPEVIYRTERINARLAELKAESERIRREAEMRLEEQRAQIAEQKARITEALEPTYQLKNDIIEKQNRLIDLLYSSGEVPEEARALREEIENDRNRLSARPAARIAGLARSKSPEAIQKNP